MLEYHRGVTSVERHDTRLITRPATGHRVGDMQKKEGTEAKQVKVAVTHLTSWRLDYTIRLMKCMAVYAGISPPLP